MKKVCIALILVSILTSLAFGATSEIGRYQLFQGFYKSIDGKNNATHEEKEVFKIDTVTGKVWRYYSMLASDGTLLEGWSETERKPQ